jgi:hypothetical protein
VEFTLRFPIVGVSKAGWAKAASELGDFTDASSDDDLQEWQGLEIYDSAGMCYVVKKAYRGFPTSKFWFWFLCKLNNHCIHVGLDLDAGTPVSVQALQKRLVSVGELQEIDSGFKTHEEVIKVVL